MFTHSILYQRGIYPAESFKQVQKYGLNMLVTDDDKLNDFFTKFLHQLSSTSACIASYSSMLALLTRNYIATVRLASEG